MEDKNSSLVFAGSVKELFDSYKEYSRHRSGKQKRFSLLNSEESEELDSLLQTFISETSRKEIERSSIDTLLQDLICYSKINLDSHLACLIEKGVSTSHEILSAEGLRTCEAIEKRKIDDLETYLASVAWMQNNSSIQILQNLTSESPPWIKRLFVSPIWYSYVAGWEPTNDNAVRLLYSKTCYEFNQTESSQTAEIVIDAHTSKPCIHCNRKLSKVTINESMTKNGLLRFPKTVDKLQFEFCDLCLALSTVHLHQLEVSNEFISTEAKIFEPADWFQEASEDQTVIYLQTSTETKHPMESAFNLGGQTLGGYPAWQQDPEFEKCAECNQSMFFVFQLDLYELGFYEGMLYFLACQYCEGRYAILSQNT